MTRFATFTSRLAVALTTTLAIAACGGGGGGSDGGFKGPGESGPEYIATYDLQVALKDSEGNPSSTVTANQPGTLQVLVRELQLLIIDGVPVTENDPNDIGPPVPNLIVTRVYRQRITRSIQW